MRKQQIFKASVQTEEVTLTTTWKGVSPNIDWAFCGEKPIAFIEGGRHAPIIATFPDGRERYFYWSSEYPTKEAIMVAVKYHDDKSSFPIGVYDELD